MSPEFTFLLREGYYQGLFSGFEGEWTINSLIDAKDGLLWRFDRLCVPRDSELRLRLFFELRDNGSIGHIGDICTFAKARDFANSPRF
jgi:hypothetical protein